MLRTASFALMALLVLPSAGALSGAPTWIAIGPEGLADPYRDEPYFLWATFSAPEIHEGAGAEDDCGAGTERADVPTAILALVDPIPAWHPTEYLSFNDIFPQCIAAQLKAPCDATLPSCPPPLPGRAYAAYDVGTGRFYAEAALETGAVALPIGMSLGSSETQNAEEELIVGGNSGVSLLADCETCPPPCC